MRLFPHAVMLLTIALPAIASAQEPDASGDESALAKQTQNPVADLTSLPFQFNFLSGGGLAERSSLLLNIQPVLPINVTERWNVIARPIIPIVNVPEPDGGSDTGLGDIQAELFLSPSGGTLVWGVGPIFTLPTATLDVAGNGSWAVGPAGVVVFTRGPWVLGGLATQQWSFAGDGRDVDKLLVQPFANFNFGRGWALVSAPIITADWEAPNNGWIVPLGGGLSWTTKIGNQAMNLGAQYYYRVERPDFEGRSELRLVISFLFPKEHPTPAGPVAHAQP